jgi:hypothetical protein
LTENNLLGQVHVVSFFRSDEDLVTMHQLYERLHRHPTAIDLLSIALPPTTSSARIERSPPPPRWRVIHVSAENLESLNKFVQQQLHAADLRTVLLIVDAQGFSRGVYGPRDDQVDEVWHRAVAVFLDSR